MGGGGAMRSAAKAAGIGFASGSTLRGAPPSLPHPEHHAVSSALKSTRPVSAVISSSSRETSNNPDVIVHQRPSWELVDDWEFAGGVEEDLCAVKNNNNNSEPLPRVVFGGPPSLLEAEQVTSELKDALEKEYLKGPDSNGFGSGFQVYQEPKYSELKNPVVPKDAIRAFRFLSESPVAQTVVASIASDPKVWNAVFENEAFAEYIHSQKTGFDPSNVSVVDGESKYPESPKDSEVSFESSQIGVSETNFLDILKLKVADMVDSLYGFFQNFFGSSEADKKSADADANGHSTFMDATTLGASVMGLALMVITLVVLKRV